MFTERAGLIVWLNSFKGARVLEKFGTLHYVSKKMKYAVLYVNKDRLPEIEQKLEQLHIVKKVERSYRNEIKTEYDTSIPDKTRFYSI